MVSRRRPPTPAPRRDVSPTAMIPREPRFGLEPPSRGEDPDLYVVRDWIAEQNNRGAGFGGVIRETFDQIYDGQRTGRWDPSQLSKTEKTHIGTLMQINLQKEFEIPDGSDLDYMICGIEVDIKFSGTIYGWMIPEEMYKKDGPQLALVVSADDYSSRWAAGVVRIEPTYLTLGEGNKDKKRSLSSEGRDRVLWVSHGNLVANSLLQMDDNSRRYILETQSGQEAINRLFREQQGRLINRATVLTVAQQDDPLKRVRDARIRLKPEGIVIFGHYKPHPADAVRLGLPRPSLGRFVSARLAPWIGGDARHFIEIKGKRWRLADGHDPVVAAPSLAKQGRQEDLTPTPEF
jgi:hypothetical protein